MTIDMSIVRKAIQSARKHDADRVLLTLNNVSYGFWREEMATLQRHDPHVRLLINTAIKTGCIEVENIQDSSTGPRKLYDCQQRSAKAAG